MKAGKRGKRKETYYGGGGGGRSPTAADSLITCLLEHRYSAERGLNDAAPDFCSCVCEHKAFSTLQVIRHGTNETK